MIWVICNVHFDNGLLGYFLRYYRERGVDRFGLLSRTDLGKLGDDVEVYRVDEEYKHGPRDNEWLNWFRENRLNANDWFIPTDLDEFYWTPGFKSFKDLIGGWEYIPAKFFDRLSVDGKIRDLDLGLTLDAQLPLGGSIVKELHRGCDDKVAFARGYVEVNSGHHYAYGYRVAPFSMWCHHFKFCGQEFWRWSYYRHSLKGYCAAIEVSHFLRHYRIFNAINIFDLSYKVIDSPLIGI